MLQPFSSRTLAMTFSRAHGVRSRGIQKSERLGGHREQGTETRHGNMLKSSLA